MVHKWLEDWYDTLLYLIVVVGGLTFFLWYWKCEYQTRYAEAVIQNFLTDVSVDGKITWMEYEELIQNLDKINSRYTVEITSAQSVLQPIHALLPEQRLKEYYIGRNHRRETSFLEGSVSVEEEKAETLRFQSETNATILAAVKKNWLPLPEEEQVWKIEAVRPAQEVYEGETLITVCRVSSEDGIFYVEADTVTATVSGEILLQVVVGGELNQVPVEVTCYPRIVQCDNGHKVVNSVAVVNGYKETGRILCPYCALYPKEISCNVTLVQKETGEKLTKEEISITVTYLDGHTEIVTPESEEWQDSYDECFCGMQQVIVFFRGAEDTVVVLSENGTCLECDNACNERSYTDYSSFPYCTECMSHVLLFSGEVYEEMEWIPMGEIIAYLDKEGEYCLQRGDFVRVVLSAEEQVQSILQKEVLQDGKYR